MEREKELEKKAVVQVASLMCLAARTAPKARGIDNIVISLFSEAEKNELVSKMEQVATEGYLPHIFSRDAKNVRESQAVIVIGITLGLRGLDCQMCGFETCAACKKAGARCAHDVFDLGIALGSAVSVAADHRVDNRMMFTIGYAVDKYKLLGEKIKLAIGIPLSASGKNIFFDRK